MIIGIDLDSTLIKTNTISTAAKELNMNYTEFDAINWNLTNFPEELRKRAFELFTITEHMCDNAIPIEGSQQKIKEWSDLGYKLVLITARVKEIRTGTIDLVNRLFPEIKDINFVNLDESKAATMSAKNLKFWVDDAVSGCSDSMKLGIDTYMISNDYTKYNWTLRDKVKYFKHIGEININQTNEAFVD